MELEEARGIYDSIVAYRGGQLTDWHDFERDMFLTVANVFQGWLRTNGLSTPQSIGQGTITTLLQTLEATLDDAARSFDAPERMGSNLITADVQGYKVRNLKSFLGAIHSIGSNGRANRQPYVIEYKDGTRVFLAQTTHYAYPIRLGTTDLTTLAAYAHDYATLMSGARDTGAEVVAKALARGEAPAATPTDMDLLTVFTANYVCESNRNWVQLLLSLIQLGTYSETTFEAKTENAFPMGGGGWKNRNSWGPGDNPNSPPTGGEGNDIKRWCLGVLMKLTVGVGALGKDDWAGWIMASADGDVPYPSDIMETVTDLLNSSVAEIERKAR